jgi:D-glycero-alpha-D-manno-heptose-7-phosphate kinase
VVISRTPLRVSFVGGGSDLDSFARRHGGAVVSTTIDKYIYVVVTERFEDNIRVSYTRTEIVDSVGKLKHDLVREALRLAGLPRKVEIVTIADVPAQGTGLGSSSAVTVGVLNALYAYQGILKAPAELAAEASYIEIDVLKKPIGKQDQYATAFGGLQLLHFGPGDSVERDLVILPEAERRALERNLMLFYTGKQRSAAKVLRGTDASAGSRDTTRSLGRLRDLARELYEEMGKGNSEALGEYLHKGWEYKRRLGGVTSPKVDRWYADARAAGAIGGKLLGAGGGGFMLFYAPRDRHDEIRKALPDLREVSMRFDTTGSRIIHIGR